MAYVKCWECTNGQVLVRNDGQWPGLPSTVAAKCPRCAGTGMRPISGRGYYEEDAPGYDEAS